MERPVKNVGIIFAAGMGQYHKQDMADLRQSFCGPETEHLHVLGDGIRQPKTTDVRDMFNELARPDAGRSLLVIMADARRPGIEPREQQPLPFGGVSPAQAYLRELSNLFRRNPVPHSPLDVFVLSAQPARLSQRYGSLPTGSTIISLKTPAAFGTNNWMQALKQRSTLDQPWPVAPGAKELLLDYMLSDGQFARARSHKSVRWPDITVMGHYSRATISDVWHRITAQEPVGEEIIEQNVQRLDALQQMMGYGGALINQAANRLRIGGKPQCPAGYAGALLAGRPELFGLESDWSWIDWQAHSKGRQVDLELPLETASGQASIIQTLQSSCLSNDGTDAGSQQTPAAPVKNHAQRRLTAAEIAAMPAFLRPLARVPAVRRLMR